MKLIPLILLSLAMPAQAEVYKTVTPDGQVVYSDTPTTGARPMNVPEITTYAPPPLPVLAPVQRPDEITAVYDSFEVDSPGDESTVRDSVGNIEMLVTLQPGLIVKQGHRIEYYDNGKQHGRPTVDTRKVFTSLDRGEHTLSAVVIDENGQQLISTRPVTVYLHKPSILHPNNPLNPANRPPATP